MKAFDLYAIVQKHLNAAAQEALELVIEEHGGVEAFREKLRGMKHNVYPDVPTVQTVTTESIEGFQFTVNRDIMTFTVDPQEHQFCGHLHLHHGRGQGFANGPGLDDMEGE